MRRVFCLAAALSIHCQSPAPATPSQVPPPPSAVSDRPASTLSPSAPRPTIPIATDDEAQNGRLVDIVLGFTVYHTLPSLLRRVSAAA